MIRKDRIQSRQEFFNLLDKEVKRATRYKYPFCILKVTLFKFPGTEEGKLQDCFDRMIHLAEKELRESDIPGVISKNELAFICPYTDSSNSSLVRDRLEKQLKIYGFKKSACEVKVERICFPGDASKISDLIDLLVKPAA